LHKLVEMPRSNKSPTSPVKAHVGPSKLQTLPQTPLALHSPPPSSFGQIMKEGLGFGIGQSIAHRAVSAVLGPTINTVTTSETKSNCVSERNAFETCMKTKNGEHHCNNEFLSYKQCIELY
jgi:hypothetical protein